MRVLRRLRMFLAGLTASPETQPWLCQSGPAKLAGFLAPRRRPTPASTHVPIRPVAAFGPRIGPSQRSYGPGCAAEWRQLRDFCEYPNKKRAGFTANPARWSNVSCPTPLYDRCQDLWGKSWHQFYPILSTPPCPPGFAIRENFLAVHGGARGFSAKNPCLGNQPRRWTSNTAISAGVIPLIRPA